MSSPRHWSSRACRCPRTASTTASRCFPSSSAMSHRRTKCSGSTAARLAPASHRRCDTDLSKRTGRPAQDSRAAPLARAPPPAARRRCIQMCRCCSTWRWILQRRMPSLTTTRCPAMPSYRRSSRRYRRRTLSKLSASFLILPPLHLMHPERAPAAMEFAVTDPKVAIVMGHRRLDIVLARWRQGVTSWRLSVRAPRGVAGQNLHFGS
mmetsp:Transcript_20852/g.31094  ORF Transcript_20852/g.31094 Transcript_20852/m.31094 type:complete len:208 (-) Transcript_20852:232-855(-)